MTVGVRHLRAFLAIAEAGTITRAAARLHLTQPALSRTLRDLEAHLGVRLVDRSTHHLELTEAGVVFRSRAAAAVTAVDEVLDPALVAGWPLRLGHAWSALGTHTAGLVRRWRERHPGTPLRLLRLDDRSAGLADGRADVAVLREPAAGTLPRTRSVLLLTEPRVAAVPADSPLARRPSLRLADLAAHPVALNTVTGTTTPGLWLAGEAPSVTVPVANTDDWLVAIATGGAVGVTTAATAVLHLHPGVAFVPLLGVPPVPVRLAWRDPPSHPAVPALVALAQEVVAAARDDRQEGESSGRGTGPGKAPEPDVKDFSG